MCVYIYIYITYIYIYIYIWRGEGTVDWDAAGSNRSTENPLSTSDKQEQLEQLELRSLSSTRVSNRILYGDLTMSSPTTCLNKRKTNKQRAEFQNRKTLNLNPPARYLLKKTSRYKGQVSSPSWEPGMSIAGMSSWRARREWLSNTTTTTTTTNNNNYKPNNNNVW